MLLANSIKCESKFLILNFLFLFYFNLIASIKQVTRLKKKLKITQLEKVCLIKVNELKLTQDELFSFFHFMCAVANASKLFCMAHIANNQCFLYPFNLSF